MKFIGITETYDPCFVPDWETRLLESNIIISKELSDEISRIQKEIFEVGFK